MPLENPIVDAPLLAHRGASLYAPENTLQAVELAAKMGAKWIETDVQLTADNQLAVIHDLTLDRTTNGSGFVAKHTLSQIRSLDAGSWFNGNLVGFQVPTLEEFATCILDHKLNLQLELKELPGRENQLADHICERLQQIWPFERQKLFLSGFSERCLKRVAQHLPDVPRALALVCVPENPDALAEEVGSRIIQVQDKFVDDAALEAIRNSSVEFGVATVNDPARARQLLEAGVQSILTDDPLLLDRDAVRARHNAQVRRRAVAMPGKP